MVDRLISPTAAGEDDEPLQTALRPRTLDEFDVFRVAAVQLGKSCRAAFDVQDVNLVERIFEHGGEFGVGGAEREPV